jgi:hypothetical protein
MGIAHQTHTHLARDTRYNPSFVPVAGGPAQCGNNVSNRTVFDSSAQLRELACVRAFDSNDGNVSCASRVLSVQRLPPVANAAQEWVTNGPHTSYGLARRVNGTCIARDVHSQNAPGFPLQIECTAIEVGLSAISPSALLGTRYVITYRGTDGTGNVAETSVTAVVEDALGPTFTFPPGPRTIPYVSRHPLAIFASPLCLKFISSKIM